MAYDNVKEAMEKEANKAVSDLVAYHGVESVLRAMIRDVCEIQSKWEDKDMIRECSREIAILTRAYDAIRNGEKA